MSMTQVYTAVPNDVITAARWNNEFGNIYNNGTAVAFPVTTSVSFAGFTVTLDASGVSTIVSPSTTGFSLTPGVKSGTPGTTGGVLNIVASTFTDSNTAASGTAAAFTGVSIQRPTLAASNVTVTTTDAASLYIANAPLAGTNETITNPWAIWVDSGAVRFDGNLTVTGTLTATGVLTGAAGPAGQFAPNKHIEGLTWGNNAGDVTNDIDIAVGSATSTHATPASRVTLVLGTALIKKIDAAWVTGTNQGGLSSSLTLTNDTTYFVHLIRVAGVDDIGFDTSITAATLIADHAATHFRMIGMVRRNTDVNALFTVMELSGGGVEYIWTDVTEDFDLAATLTTTRRTDAIRVPLVFSVHANVNIVIDDAAASLYYVYDAAHADQNPALADPPGFTMRNYVAGQDASVPLRIRTSATGTIAAEANVATADSYRCYTLSFEWSRR